MSEELKTAGVSWLESLLSLQGLPASVATRMVEDEGGSSCWLIIDESQLSESQIETIIGPRGAALDSLQYLANTLLNLGKEAAEQQAFTIELAGYREQRQAELQALATHAAEQAKTSGEEFEIRDLSSAERRQVHNFLKSYEGLETFSRGKEPDRRLVVRQAEDRPERDET
ncbi:MAG TPA: R3H domain-containing nucleic acid-binding protein [Trichocoleus sp.]